MPMRVLPVPGSAATNVQPRPRAKAIILRWCASKSRCGDLARAGLGAEVAPEVIMSEDFV